MEKQIIITVAREYGSAGHLVAKELANRFGIAYYDRNLLDEVAARKNADPEKLRKHDETPKNLLFSRNVNGYSNSVEDIVAEMQFEFLKEKANAGDSFVVVGRCADYVLKDNPNVVSVFITGDKNIKIKRVMESRNMSEILAKATIKKHDKSRKKYYEYYTENTWGFAGTYEFSINDSKLGIEGTADIIETYVKARLGL